MKRRFRLLTKVLFFYLLFTLASFLIGAYILQSEADKHMNNILENRFRHRERWIEKGLSKKPEKIKNLSHTKITYLKKMPANTSVRYSDTIMVNQHTQQRQIFRKKTMYMTVNDTIYRVEMVKDAVELYRFRDDIFHIVLPAFLFLACFLLLANYILSGYLFEPFRKILKQMASYKIGGTNSVPTVKTSTREFLQLKNLFESMQKRIESDFFQLKEYTENMSHELQTPLSVIQHKAENLLSDENMSMNQLKQLKMIYDETNQLSKLSSALNLITKIENKEFGNIQRLQTKTILLSHIERVAELASLKGLKISYQLDDNHTFEIDRNLLDILIRNLMKNAIHYTPEGGIIEIKTDDSQMIFSNQGESLPFEPEKLFKRFSHGDNKHSVGLGLAIAKKITQVSHLTISYEYRNNKHLFTVSPLKQNKA